MSQPKLISLILVAVVINGAVNVDGRRMLGSLSAEKPSTEEVQKLANAVKDKAEDLLNEKFSMFDAVSYATQMVAGTNYFIKVKTGEDSYIHLRVFKPFLFVNRKPRLVAAVGGKSQNDKLQYFAAEKKPVVHGKNLRRLMLGGLSGEKPATEEVQKLADAVKSKAETLLDKKFSMFKAVKYAEQAVVGTNFFIKVQVGQDHYIFLRVYKPLPFLNRPPSLAAVLGGKSKDDKIRYFTARRIVIARKKTPRRRVGGLSEEKAATDEIQRLADGVKSKAEDLLNMKFSMFDAVSYATQMVAGTNYFIKVKVGEDSYIHLRVFKPFLFVNRKPYLVAAVGGKSQNDKLQYFAAERKPVVHGKNLRRLMLGGLSGEKPATEEVQKLADAVKSKAETLLDKTFSMFKAVKYAEQAVVGTNFFIKVQVGQDHYIFLRVYKPLPFLNRKPSLAAVLGGKTKDDKISYFSARRIVIARKKTPRRRVGGLSEAKAATDKIQQLADGVKSKAEDLLNMKFSMFKAVKYAEQRVVGNNYYIKVQVGDDSYIHLRVYKPLPFMNRKPSLVAVLGGKSKDDKIEYFAAARRIIGWRVRTHGRRRLGGSSKEKPATDEIQKLVDGVKSKAESMLDAKFSMFTAVKYREQMVAGTNYFIKVKVGEDSYIHMKIFKPLPYMNKKPFLAAVVGGKKQGDKIGNFRPAQGRIILPRVGGLSNEKPATEEIQQLADGVKSRAEAFLDQKFSMFKAVKYAEQRVVGTNYFIKVQVGHDSYIHLRVYKPLPFMNKKPFLAAALGGKGKEDKIKYFSTSRRIVVWRKKIQRKRLGGSSEEKQATDEIQKLVDAVKSKAESMLDQKFSMFTAVKYREQMVAGTNYFIKVKVGEDSYIHMKIFKALPYMNKKPFLAAVVGGKRQGDKIGNFRPAQGRIILPRVGGLSNEKPATEEIQQLADGVKSHAEHLLDKKFSMFKAVKYSVQRVAGTNYFIKVQVGDDSYVHLMVYKPLPFMNRKPSLVNVAGGKSEKDKLDFLKANHH